MLLMLSVFFLIIGMTVVLGAAFMPREAAIESAGDPVRTRPLPTGARDVVQLRFRAGALLCAVGLVVLGAAIYVEVHDSRVAVEMMSRGAGG